MSIWTDICPTCNRLRHQSPVCSNGFHVEHLHHPEDPPGIIRGPIWRKTYIYDLEADLEHAEHTVKRYQPIVDAALVLVQLNPIQWEDSQALVDFCRAVWDFEVLNEKDAFSSAFHTFTDRIE